MGAVTPVSVMRIPRIPHTQPRPGGVVVRKSVFIAGIVAIVAAVGPMAPALAGGGGGTPPTVSGTDHRREGDDQPRRGGRRRRPRLRGRGVLRRGHGHLVQAGRGGRPRREVGGRARPTTAPFRTRIVVYRPEQKSDFNGTAIVEWLNVTAGFESAPDWGNSHTWMAARGRRLGRGLGAGRRRAGRRADRRRRPRRRPEGGRPRALRHARSTPATASPTTSSRRSGGPSPATRHELARRPEAEARDRGRRVAVGVPARHLHQRRAPDGEGVRRVPRAQPGRTGAPLGVTTDAAGGAGSMPRRPPRSAATTRRPCSRSRPRPTSRHWATSRHASPTRSTSGCGRWPARRTPTSTPGSSTSPTAETAARSAPSSTRRRRTAGRSRAHSR